MGKTVHATCTWNWEVCIIANRPLRKRQLVTPTDRKESKPSGVGFLGPSYSEEYLALTWPSNTLHVPGQQL